MKVGRFEPEYLGKLSFYLEALDRDVKKSHEHSAIGVLLCASKDAEVERILSASSGSGIIYSATVKEAERLHEQLKDRYSIGLYHGKMNPPDRKASQNAFMHGGLAAMIATNAFGLDIDKRDLRFVVQSARCRTRFLLEYFGEPVVDEWVCDNCDACDAQVTFARRTRSAAATLACVTRRSSSSVAS